MFIRLHGASGNAVRINADNIESYQPITEDMPFGSSVVGMSLVTPLGSDINDSYIIRETCDEIDRLVGVIG